MSSVPGSARGERVDIRGTGRDAFEADISDGAGKGFGLNFSRERQD